MNITTKIGIKKPIDSELEECRRAFLNIYGMYSPSAALAFATQLTPEQVQFIKNDPRTDVSIKQVLDSL